MVKYGKINGEVYKIVKMSKCNEDFALEFLTHDSEGKNLRVLGEITITKLQAITLGKFLLGKSTEDHIPNQ